MLIRKIALERHTQAILKEGSLILSGRMGTIQIITPREVHFTKFGSYLHLCAEQENKNILKTFAAIIQNSITGTNRGFIKILKLHGLGYKAWTDKNTLLVKAGTCHTKKYLLDNGIKLHTYKNKYIYMLGVSKPHLFSEASRIKGLRKPDPYKGKGILYIGETVRLKGNKKR